jgi:hypothetical protein
MLFVNKGIMSVPLKPGIGGARAAKERGIGCVIAAAFDDVQFLDESISAYRNV